ncbi:DUF72 domain-containing protein [Archangium lipolyticum]|uniref:DUF72 domain-containing protein n=1 Tax=Archangium lipolyticum TaxID=2970465 RepID=UPI002149EB69|nr:DUF72 domain-containing protein [Archangium lipolyticum]
MSDRDPSQLDLFTGAPSPTPPRGRRRGHEEPVGPAEQPEDVRALGEQLPPGLHLGTSSWSFPGWKGIVYDREATAARLSREGLAAYSRHPVLRTVGVDRTFYAPIPASAFADYAAQVPPGFRFLVKAHEACTLARWPVHQRYGDLRGQFNDRFLDAAYARDLVVAPFVEGLGEKAGPLVFQLPPQHPEDLSEGGPFVERLHAFFSALPRGPLYAAEFRNESLLTEALAQALADVGVCPVLAAWKNMPPVERQAVRTKALNAPALVVRWMLPPNLDYEEARRRYFPFDKLVDEDVRTREAIARVSAAALGAGRPVFVTLNNKAEGSAPLSAVLLARSVMSRTRNTGSVES